MRAPPQDAAEIARMLAGRAPELARELLPGGRREGAEWRCGNLAGERGQSLGVHLTGQKAGVWRDFATGEAGDALSLVAAVLYRGDVRPALAWARQWLGLGAGAPIGERRAVPPLKAMAPMEVVPNATLPLARNIWREAVAAAGTPVEHYLVSRGLSLPSGAPLRFHPACPRRDERLPAMIALMTDAVTGTPCGIHRTFLLPDGSGKAAGQAKMMLGDTGVVRLTADDEVTLGLGIAEGIETAISVLQVAGWAPIWAACSAGAITTFPVLGGVECLTIFADADETGAGIKAARACANRWLEAGRQAIVHFPDIAGSDWNDVARGAV